MYQDALAAYDRATQLTVRNAEVWNNKGLAYAALGRYQDALQCFNKALGIQPDFPEALKNKESITVTRSLDQVWLCRYPRPVDCLHDNGTEFVSAEFQELLQSYGIKSKLTTVKNPQANGILERTHQVIGNLLRSSHLITQDLTSIAGPSCGPSTQCSTPP